MTLIDRIRKAGIEIKAQGDRLQVRGTLSSAQRDWLSDNKAVVLAELRMARRPIVEYRHADGDVWHVMLGRPGESFEEAVAAAHHQFGAVLTRERETLPAGFPFKRLGDEGEFKSQDTTEQ